MEGAHLAARHSFTCIGKPLDYQSNKCDKVWPMQKPSNFKRQRSIAGSMQAPSNKQFPKEEWEFELAFGAEARHLVVRVLRPLQEDGMRPLGMHTGHASATVRSEPGVRVWATLLFPWDLKPAQIWLQIANPLLQRLQRLQTLSHPMERWLRQITHAHWPELGASLQYSLCGLCRASGIRPLHHFKAPSVRRSAQRKGWRSQTLLHLSEPNWQLPNPPSCALSSLALRHV